MVQSRAVDAGVYLVIGAAQFAQNSSGARSVTVNSSATTASVGRIASTVQPSSGSVTRVQFARILTYPTAGSVYVHVSQSSGSTLSVSPSINMIRLR